MLQLFPIYLKNRYEPNSTQRAFKKHACKRRIRMLHVWINGALRNVQIENQSNFTHILYAIFYKIFYKELSTSHLKLWNNKTCPTHLQLLNKDDPRHHDPFAWPGLRYAQEATNAHKDEHIFLIHHKDDSYTTTICACCISAKEKSKTFDSTLLPRYYSMMCVGAQDPCLQTIRDTGKISKLSLVQFRSKHFINFSHDNKLSNLSIYFKIFKNCTRINQKQHPIF